MAPTAIKWHTRAHAKYSRTNTHSLADKKAFLPQHLPLGEKNKIIK